MVILINSSNNITDNKTIMITTTIMIMPIVTTMISSYPTIPIIIIIVHIAHNPISHDSKNNNDNALKLLKLCLYGIPSGPTQPLRGAIPDAPPMNPDQHPVFCDCWFMPTQRTNMYIYIPLYTITLIQLYLLDLSMKQLNYHIFFFFLGSFS